MKLVNIQLQGTFPFLLTKEKLSEVRQHRHFLSLASSATWWYNPKDQKAAFFWKDPPCSSRHLERSADRKAANSSTAVANISAVHVHAQRNTLKKRSAIKTMFEMKGQV